MLIQLENQTVVNTDNIILKPLNKDCNQNKVAYQVLTSQDLRHVTDISPREYEVILHLTANAPEQKMVLRTPEWGLVDGKLNYRYAKNLSAKVDGGYGTEGLLTWLKGRLEASCKDTATSQDRAEILNIINDLRQDREFYDMTAEGRTIIRDTMLSDISGKKTVEKILSQWDEIFIDLPF